MQEKKLKWTETCFSSRIFSCNYFQRDHPVLPFTLFCVEVQMLHHYQSDRSLNLSILQSHVIWWMFRTVNMDVINACRLYFDFMLPSDFMFKRKSNFLRKCNSCSSTVCHFGLGETCEMCVTISYFLLVS